MHESQPLISRETHDISTSIVHNIYIVGENNSYFYTLRNGINKHKLSTVYIQPLKSCLEVNRIKNKHTYMYDTCETCPLICDIY